MLELFQEYYWILCRAGTALLLSMLVGLEREIRL